MPRATAAQRVHGDRHRLGEHGVGVVAAVGHPHVPCSAEGSAAIRRSNPGLPVVEYARRSAAEEVDSVTGDEERGMAALVEHLAALGHTRIGLISGVPGLSTTAARVAGLEGACRRLRLRRRDCPRLGGPYDVAWGQVATVRLLEEFPQVTAIIASSARSALGMLKALHGAGVRVPAEMSVVGFLAVVPVGGRSDTPSGSARSGSPRTVEASSVIG